MELVVTIVLIGILAAVAAPKMLGGGMAGPTFSEATRVALRHAQKSAIASRRVVCAEFTGSSLSLRIASTAGSRTCDKPLLMPGENTAYLLDAQDKTYQGNTGYAPLPANNPLLFDALGRPIKADGSVITSATQITITGGNSLTIEAETGHVH